MYQSIEEVMKQLNQLQQNFNQRVALENLKTESMAGQRTKNPEFFSMARIVAQNATHALGHRDIWYVEDLIKTLITEGLHLDLTVFATLLRCSFSAHKALDSWKLLREVAVEKCKECGEDEKRVLTGLLGD